MRHLTISLSSRGGARAFAFRQNNLQAAIPRSRANTNNALLSHLRFDYSPDVTESDYRQLLVAKNLPCSTSLRQHYDGVYHDPREPSSQRFVWDSWVVKCGEGTNGKEAPLPGDPEDQEVEPGQRLQPPCEGEREAAARQIQYSLKRAQCSEFFESVAEEDDDADSKQETSEDDGEHGIIYAHLIDQITQLGQSIGCSCTTPPWISVYTPGDQQNLHIDSSHGPMAWVLSITNDADYGTAFVGGETLLLQPRILQYWKDFNPKKGGKEAPSIMRYIPPTFGQCIAFDGRVPHGVNLVRGGSNDPRQGRIVIHGWFAEPEICWLGDDTNEFAANVDGKQDEAQAILEAQMSPILETLGSSEIGRVVGYLALRLDIAPDGTVDRIDAVCDTLQADPADYQGVIGEDSEGRPVMEDATADIRLTIHENLADMYFPESKDGGSVVVPFDFL
jgi:hypothetical protein